MITLERFNCIKILLQSGASDEEVINTLKVNAHTLKLVKNSKTYADYKSQRSADLYALKAKNAPKKEEPAPAPATQVIEHRQNVTVQATHYMEGELKKCVELLTGISAKVAFLVEELAGGQNAAHT